MYAETRLWRFFLPIIVTLITCAAPIFVIYDLYYRGSIPEKCLELDKRQAINPLWDLNIKSKNVTLNLCVGNETFNNVVIKTFTLRNTGKAPIVSADYHEPISVEVKPPWKIIAVEQNPMFEGITITLTWQRVSGQRFEAKPALINPGDYIIQNVYLTNSEYSLSEKIASFPKVDIEVNARITNMRRFTAPRSIFDVKAPVGFTVYLDGPAVLFTVVSASIFLFWYLLMLQKAGLLGLFGWKSCLTVVGLAVLSFSVAEVIAYYIFGGYPPFSFIKPSLLDWRAEWHNWFVLILHICISIYLYRRSKVRPNIAGTANR